MNSGAARTVDVGEKMRQAGEIAATAKSGNSTDKIYYRHSGRIGSLKQRTFAEQMEVSSEEVMRLAVKRMLRRGPLGNKQLTKLKCFRSEHTHQAQMPKEIDLKNGKQIAEVIYDS